MLSVLIPVYNFNVVPFVNDLIEQCVSSNIEFELICLDDCSEALYKTQNSKLKSLTNVIYEELSSNIGRSKIRNQLAEKSKFDNLLFLDCDSKTNNAQFISNYISKINGQSIIYGGRNYEKNPPENNDEYFRWWYGMQRETIGVMKRTETPYDHFMTNNFLIPRSIFFDIKLNEEIRGYGHEDTLFGIELKKRNIPILHIDNPLCHIGLESFETYIQKTEEGIVNLNRLINGQKIDNSVRLYKAFRRMKTFGLSGAIVYYFRKNREKILNKMQGEKPNLKWFDFYKLGYLLSLRKS